MLPVFGDVFDLLPGALAIAIMAFLETVLVARTNRQRSEPQIDTDQELLATGVAALAGGLTQTLPLLEASRRVRSTCDREPSPSSRGS